MSTDTETKPATTQTGGAPVVETNPDLKSNLWWSYLATGWTGASGVLLDAAMDPNLIEHIALTGGAGLAGSFVGGAIINVDNEAHRRLILEAGLFGTATGLAAGAWAWCADNAQLFEHIWQPNMWGALALGGIAWGSVLTALRARFRRARNPESPTAAKLRKTELGGVFEQIFHDGGFGVVEVIEVESGFGGASERAIVELDYDRNDTAHTVIAAEQKLMGVTARIMRERRGIRIPGNAVKITEVQGDAKRVCFDVTLKDMLTESFDPSDGEDITTPVLDPKHPLILGYFKHGAFIEQPESGPHGIAVGASGSGKSTYYRAQIIQYLRRPHVALGVASMSKLGAFLRPFMQPVVNGVTNRSPFAIIGGGDTGTASEVDSAVDVIKTAYMLYRQRMANPRLPRDDGGNLIPTKEHPRFIVYLDEIDALVKAMKGRGDNVSPNQHAQVVLPNGEKVTVPEMLTTVGSKGRSEGVEWEYGTQRTTDSHMGFSGNDLFVNTHRRAIFRTQSNHDARSVGGDRLDPTRIPEHTFLLALGPKAEQIPGKVFYYTHEHIALAMQAAEVNGTFGDLSGEEAAALGDLWSGRFSRARYGNIAAYFGLPLPDGSAPTPPSPAATATAVADRPTPQSRTGKVDRVGPKSTRLQDAINRANASNNDTTPANTSEDFGQADVDAAIEGLEKMLASNTNGPVPRDTDPGELRNRVLDVIGDRVGAEPGEILRAFGWVDSTTSRTDYNTAAQDLRDALRAATGKQWLRATPKRMNPRENPVRLYIRADLEGTDNQ